MHDDRRIRDLKNSLHRQTLNDIDLESLDQLSERAAREQVSQFIRDKLEKENTPLALAEREQVIREILDEFFGYGPIQPLLDDPRVSDILVNGCDNVFIEWNGVLDRTDVKFDDDQHLMRIIERIVSRVGRRVDESSPMAPESTPSFPHSRSTVPCCPFVVSEKTPCRPTTWSRRTRSRWRCSSS